MHLPAEHRVFPVTNDKGTIIDHIRLPVSVADHYASIEPIHAPTISGWDWPIAVEIEVRAHQVQHFAVYSVGQAGDALLNEFSSDNGSEAFDAACLFADSQGKPWMASGGSELFDPDARRCWSLKTARRIEASQALATENVAVPEGRFVVSHMEAGLPTSMRFRITRTKWEPSIVNGEPVEIEDLGYDYGALADHRYHGTRKAANDALRLFAIPKARNDSEAVSVLRLPSFGIAIYGAEKGFPNAHITSDLHEDGESEAAKSAFDAIEAMVLGHACAGIDVTSPAYLEGLETAVLVRDEAEPVGLPHSVLPAVAPEEHFQ